MINQREMKFHETASIFPMMSGMEFSDLKKDIELFGQKNPITIFEDKILDGRNRFKALSELGINPITQEFHVNGQKPLDFVISANMHRRHLTQAQKTAVAVLIKEKMMEEQKGLPTHAKKRTDEAAGAIFGISHVSVSHLYTVKRRNQKLFDMVMQGKSSVEHAWRMIRDPLSKETPPHIQEAAKVRSEGLKGFDFDSIKSLAQADFLKREMEKQGWCWEASLTIDRNAKQFRFEFWGKNEIKLRPWHEKTIYRNELEAIKTAASRVL